MPTINFFGHFAAFAFFCPALDEAQPLSAHAFCKACLANNDNPALERRVNILWEGYYSSRSLALVQQHHPQATFVGTLLSENYLALPDRIDLLPIVGSPLDTTAITNGPIAARNLERRGATGAVISLADARQGPCG